MNCAIGCKRSAQTGRRPIHIPTGTQIRLAMTISTITRTIVARPRPKAVTMSLAPSDASMNLNRYTLPARQAAMTSPSHA